LLCLLADRAIRYRNCCRHENFQSPVYTVAKISVKGGAHTPLLESNIVL
jgi:hypothetical protein